MTYTLNYLGKIGLWELRIVGSSLRIRYYLTRDAAMKTVSRYRQMLQSESDREDREAERERESFAQMRWDSYYEAG